MVKYNIWDIEIYIEKFIYLIVHLTTIIGYNVALISLLCCVLSDSHGILKTNVAKFGHVLIILRVNKTNSE